MSLSSKGVLYISYDGMTDPLGQSQVIPYLIGLTKEGYHFTILCCEKKDRYEKYRDHIQEICSQHNITWVPLIYTKTPPVLSTIYDLYLLNRKANEIYNKDPFEIVHARGTYITSMIALSLKRKFKVKYVFDMRGFWADERVDGNIWNINNPLFKLIYNFFKKKETDFLENADHVITLTHVAKQEIHSWTHIKNNPVPITVIPCCANMNTFSPSNVDIALLDTIREDHGLSREDYILLYLGSLGTWYMLDEMMDFFKTLLEEKNNAKFLFVTNDPDQNILGAAEKKGINKDSILILNSPFAKVPTYISIADASIFFIKPTFSKKGSSPIKQGELMAMGTPVICNDNVGDTGQIVRHYHSGVVVDQFDEVSYKKSVSELLNTKFDKQAIIKGAKEYFWVEVGIKKYLDVYREISK